MAGVSGWYGTAYNCKADPSKSHGVGWYLNGQLLASTYLNPATGNPYTMAELQGGAGGGTTPAPATGTTGTPATTTTPTPAASVSPEYDTWLAERDKLKAEHEATLAGGTTTNTPITPAPLPAIGDVNVPEIGRAHV